MSAILSVTELSDISSATGSSVVAGVLTQTETPDLSEVITGALSKTEDADISAIIVGTVVQIEADDLLATVAGPVVAGNALLTEGPDQPQLTGGPLVIGVAYLPESSDTLFARDLLSGGLSLVEAGDTSVGTGSLTITGQLNAAENPTGVGAGTLLPGSQDWGMFGSAVAFSADGAVMAVGAMQAGSPQRGTVSIFDNVGGVWVKRGGSLVPPPGGSNPGFGSSVSLSADGSVLAVGSPWFESPLYAQGLVVIYDRNGAGWTQRGSLTLGNYADRFGASVVLSNDGLVLLVGTQKDLVYTYDRNGTGWTQRGTPLAAPLGNDEFGSSLALIGDLLIVGAASYWGGPTGDVKGGVYTYERSGDAWVQRGTVLSPADLGVRVEFGRSVGLSQDGRTLAVGAPYGVNGLGCVYLFSRQGLDWVQNGEVIVAGDGEHNSYGWSVAWVSSKGLAVGDLYKNTSGAVHLYDKAPRDILTGGGTLLVSGVASITEASDQISAGQVIRGAATIAEEPDSIASTSSFPITGALASIEGADYIQHVALNAAETADVVSSAGSSPIFGAATPSETGDSVVALAGVEVVSSANLVESNDALGVQGRVENIALFSRTEDQDTLAASGWSAIFGSLNIVDPSDQCSSRESPLASTDTHGHGGATPEQVQSKWEFIELMRRICEEERGIVLEDLSDEELVDLARFVVGLFDKELLK